MEAVGEGNNIVGETKTLYAPTVPAPGPMVPPASMFGNVPGYEDTLAGGGGGYLPPPMPLHPNRDPEPAPVPQDWNIPSITEDVARERFIMYASGKCCYSNAPAKDGVITNMQAFNTYRYRLETFTESRSTEWATKPYEGEPADFYTQTAPRPWEIPVTGPSLFQNHEENIKVPYTSSNKPCHTCSASGKMPCHECNGSGTKVCWVCNGSGREGGDSPCNQCNQRGRENCSKCHGNGTKECETCKGKQQLLTYINLKVEWKNNVEDYVVEQNSGLEVDNLSDVTGKTLFKNAQYMLYPVYGFPDPSLSQASDRLVREHQAKFSQNSRILQQQQTIELIPITKVTYKWKGGIHVYYIYGNEHQVKVPDYPATCCCSIM
ncbi:protein SSUH2 homolog isoform X1 [Oncorhynchus kisutch]|uniref:protein SSUH2 homolog isoform X1 n=1 Tax=Oncorhynchus kisutch TaxID=8019 RepID=UPI0012DC188D|nr:protein SSUH2 homolog isoform X1 [Oncorhynchus kisutch]